MSVAFPGAGPCCGGRSAGTFVCRVSPECHHIRSSGPAVVDGALPSINPSLITNDTLLIGLLISSTSINITERATIETVMAASVPFGLSSNKLQHGKNNTIQSWKPNYTAFVLPMSIVWLYSLCIYVTPTGEVAVFTVILMS